MNWRISHIVSLTLVGCTLCGCTQPVDAPPVQATATPDVVADVSVDLLPTPETSPAGDPQTACDTLRFASIAGRVGLSHVYDNGAHGELLMVESLGGGAGWLDYDCDGRLDAFLCQGGDPAVADPSTRPDDQLFRQLDGDHFASVVAPAMLRGDGYSHGVAIGDFNNDGLPDIYISNAGKNEFHVNNGDGTFSEVAAALEIDDDRWSATAAWADLDRDGDLDLYVCNYLQYDAYDPLPCEKDGQPALCHPFQLPAWPDECFENLGDGRFVARAEQWGLYGPGNKGLGVAIADFNNDGKPDVYVANDTTENFLFVRQADGRFAETAIRLGAAISGEGAKQASMGVAVGDYDGNGLLDLYLTHFTGEANTLYQNLGEYGLHDVSPETGIRQATWTRLGFGTVMTDFDLNGTMELFVTNGHIDERNADGDGYEQRPQLLTFAGEHWLDCSESAGEFFSQQYVGRGVAQGDYDRDGDADLLVVHQNAPTALLANQSASGHWLSLRFIGAASNRQGVGVRVQATVAHSGRTSIHELVAGTSYCSTHERTITIGLGDSTGPVELEVRWPSGTEQTLTIETVDQHLTLDERYGLVGAKR